MCTCGEPQGQGEWAEVVVEPALHLEDQFVPWVGWQPRASTGLASSSPFPSGSVPAPLGTLLPSTAGQRVPTCGAPSTPRRLPSRSTVLSVTLQKASLLLLWRCSCFKSPGKEELDATDRTEILANVYIVFIRRDQGKFFHLIFTSRGKKNAFPISLSSTYF